MRYTLAAYALGLGLPLLPSSVHGRQDSRFGPEIQAIVARPEIRAALDVIERLEPQTQRDLISLTEIPAPPFGETPRGRHYAEMLRQAGADTVYIDAVGNVVARRRGTGSGRTVAMGGLRPGRRNPENLRSTHCGTI